MVLVERPIVSHCWILLELWQLLVLMVVLLRSPLLLRGRLGLAGRDLSLLCPEVEHRTDHLVSCIDILNYLLEN